MPVADVYYGRPSTETVVVHPEVATALVILFKGGHLQNISLALRAIGGQYVRLFDLFGPEEILEAAGRANGGSMSLRATTEKAPPKEDPDAIQD